MPELPTPATPLIGREHAVGTITDLVSDPDVRLVTLTGPGGIGKTRLALAVAGKASGEVAFASLASISRPELIPDAILRSLGVEHPGVLPDEQVLRSVLHKRRLLLVVDNLEHLLPGASMVSDLLAASPGLTVLATSRVRLGLSGEHIVAVEPLAVPDPAHTPTLEEIRSSSSVRLFVDRARAVRPGFELTDDNAEAVATICRRLEGLPLAIELAGARCNLLSPAALARRLEHRLELLTGGPRDAPQRHRTMRGAIAWSHALLPPAAQRLFRRLAVFEGGASLPEITALASMHDSETAPGEDPVIDTLAMLVDHNLVVRVDPTPGSDEPRVDMMAVIREFALEQLQASAETAAVRDAHAAVFLALAAEGERHLVHEVDPAWLDRMETDHANFRSALAWTLRDGAAPTSIATGMQLAGTLWLFWYYHSHLIEGRAWLERALAAPDDVPAPIRAKALLGHGTLLHFLGDQRQARAVLLQGLDRLRELEDISGMAYALSGLGTIAEDIGHYEDAARAFIEAQTLFTRLDDQVNIAVTRYHLGVVAVGEGDLPLATERLEGALALSRRVGDPWNTAASLSYLGLVRSAAGDIAGTTDALAEALALYRELGTTERIVEVVRRVAVLASTMPDPVPTILLFAAADAHGARLGIGQALPERAIYERALTDAGKRMPADRRKAATAEGMALSLDGAITRAQGVLDACRRRQPVTKPDGVNLTQREVEVLALLVEGASDHEIADALFITRRTASKHVAAILEKLGASNRTAAATIALRRGLL